VYVDALRSMWGETFLDADFTERPPRAISSGSIPCSLLPLLRGAQAGAMRGVNGVDVDRFQDKAPSETALTKSAERHTGKHTWSRVAVCVART